MAKKDDKPVDGDNAASADSGGADVSDISGVVELVRMVRQGDVEPKEADVHPDEVSNYQQGGWVVEYAITSE